MVYRASSINILYILAIFRSEASIDVAKNGARSRDQSEEKNEENQQVAENASEAFIQNEQLASTE